MKLPESLSLLLVDDEEIVRCTLKEFLLFLGHKIDEAEEGLTGIQMLEANHYDAAFVDMRMPRLGGMEFLRQCREKWPELPVFMVSGYATEATCKDVLEAGASGFLPKPFSFDDICQLLAKVDHK